MTSFLVTYTTKSGQKRQLALEAENPAMARRLLRQRGIAGESLLVRQDAAAAHAKTKAESEKGPPAWLDFDSITVREKALFASKLSALIDAGVPILRSIDLMRSQERSKKFRRALTAMAQDVNQGDSLGNAMRRWPQVFDNLAVAMVEAGEAGGVLDETLRRLAKLMEDSAKLQNQIRGALGYPLTVLVIAVGVFLGMTIFLIPVFAGIFDQLGAELPAFTQLLLDLSKLLRSPFSVILVGGLMLGAFLFTRYYATPAGRRQVDALLLKVPLFGDLFQKTATAQFCRTLSSLSRAGVPILMSLEIARETTSNSVIGDAILASRKDVSEGIPLSAALSNKSVFPEMAVSMLAIGEETGEMDAMLSKVADFYEDEVAALVKAMTSMLEPVMIVLVGIIVGSVLLAMYLPMFSVFKNIR
jgi:type IV pilus assembly protein PilC